jgi:hypothetical protein
MMAVMAASFSISLYGKEAGLLLLGIIILWG